MLLRGVIVNRAYDIQKTIYSLFCACHGSSTEDPTHSHSYKYIEIATWLANRIVHPVVRTIFLVSNLGVNIRRIMILTVQ